MGMSNRAAPAALFPLLWGGDATLGAAPRPVALEPPGARHGPVREGRPRVRDERCPRRAEASRVTCARLR
jgi:hypothetical protein